MQDTPDAALQAILSRPGLSPGALRLVCRRWAELAAATCIASAAPKSLTTRDDARLLHRFQGLQQLDLRHVVRQQQQQQQQLQLQQSDVCGSIRRLRSLRRLSLGNTSGSCSAGAGALHAAPLLRSLAAGCSGLTSLQLSGLCDSLVPQLAAVTHRLRSLCLAGARLSDDGAAALLSALPHLEQLSLSCCDGISDAGLAAALAAARRLRSVQLHSCMQLGDCTLAALAELGTGLTALSLSHSAEEASSAGLLRLSRLVRLQLLDLSASAEAAAPESLAALLACLPQLRTLDLSYCECLAPCVLRAAAALPQLTLLGLGALSPRVLAGGLGVLSRLGGLRVLSLRWAQQLRDTRVLAHLAALTSLDLGYCRSLTPEGLAQLQWLTQLRQLSLMSVAADDLSALAALQQLTSLTVSALPATGTAWEHIARLSGLQVLALRRCRFTAGGGSGSSSARSSSSSSSGGSNSSACLSALQQLTALDCGGSVLQAPGALRVVAALPRLQHLGLARAAGISDSALALLAGCAGLSKLDLRLRGPDSSWSATGLLALLAALPGLAAVYVSHLPPALPACERYRVLTAPSDQPPLPVSRDAAWCRPPFGALAADAGGGGAWGRCSGGE